MLFFNNDIAIALDSSMLVIVTTVVVIVDGLIPCVG